MRLQYLRRKEYRKTWEAKAAQKALEIIAKGEISEPDLMNQLGFKNRQVVRQALGPIRDRIYTVQAGKQPVHYCLRMSDAGD